MTNQDQHNKDQENWRKGWLDWEQSSAGQGWDEPSTDFWDRVSQDLPQTKKRRPVILLFFGLFLLVSLSAWWLIASPQSSKTQPELSQVPHPNATNNITSPSNTPISAIASEQKEEEIVKKENIKAIHQEEAPKISGHILSNPLSKSDRSEQTKFIAPTPVPEQIISHTTNSNQSITQNLPKASSFKSKPFLATTSPLENISIKALAIPQRSLEVAIQMPIPPKEENANSVTKGLFIGTGFAIQDPIAQIKTNDTGLIPIRSEETSVQSTAINLQLGYQISNKWSIRTGISRYRINSEHEQRFRRIFDPTQEQPTGDGRFKSSYELKMHSKYSVTETEVDFIRSANEEIASGSLLILGLRTRQELRMLHLPLLISYQNRAQDFAWSVHTGPSLSFLSGKQLNVTAEAILQRQNRPQVNLSRELSTISKTLINWQLGAELRYYFSSSLSLHLGPEFHFGLQDLYQSEEQNVRLHSLGIGLGMRYSFN